MIEQRTEELGKGFENIGHLLNTYHLINRLFTVMIKVSDNSSLASKLSSTRVILNWFSRLSGNWNNLTAWFGWRLQIWKTKKYKISSWKITTIGWVSVHWIFIVSIVQPLCVKTYFHQYVDAVGLHNWWRFHNSSVPHTVQTCKVQLLEVFLNPLPKVWQRKFANNSLWWNF